MCTTKQSKLFVLRTQIFTHNDAKKIHIGLFGTIKELTCQKLAAMDPTLYHRESLSTHTCSCPVFDSLSLYKQLKDTILTHVIWIFLFCRGLAPSAYIYIYIYIYSLGYWPPPSFWNKPFSCFLTKASM